MTACDPSIFHLINDYGAFVRRMLDIQSQAGYQPSISIIPANKTASLALSSLTEYSPTLLQSPCKYLRTPLLHFQRCLHYSENINALYSHSCFRIAHAHTLFGSALPLFLSRLKADKVVLTIRNSDINSQSCWRIPWLRSLACKVLLHSDKILFLSPSYRLKLLKLVRNPLVCSHVNSCSALITNPIHPFWFNNQYMSKLRSLPGPEGFFNILTVADIVPNKGQLSLCRLINAYASGRGLKIRYCLVGSIVDRAYFRRIVDFPFVTYLGSGFSREQLLWAYRSAHLHVLPSLTETFGLASVEALTQSLPVIVTSGEGIDGHLQEECGVFSMPSGSFHHFELIMNSIFLSYARFSALALKSSAYFSDDHCLDLYNHAYQFH